MVLRATTRSTLGVNMRKNWINTQTAGSFIIRRAELWNVEAVTESVDIAVKDGIVLKISRQIADGEFASFASIDAAGLVVLPAGVDAQVHLRVPGQERKETATSGLWAAVAGGVGSLLTMPNTIPVIDNPTVLELARRECAEAEAQTGVKVLFSAAMTKGQKGKEIVDFDGLAHAGVSAFTDDGVGVADDEIMLDVLRGASRTGRPVLQHAEIPGHGGVLAPGPVQRDLGGIAYPETAEVDMVRRDLKLLEKVPTAMFEYLDVRQFGSLFARPCLFA